MANPEHLAILKQGVEKWNQWQNSYRKPRLFLASPPHLYADLTNADLSGIDLSDVDFNRIDLRCANLRGATLIEAKLMDSHIEGADLSHADLTGAELSYVYCVSGQTFSVGGMANDHNLFYVGAPTFEDANLRHTRFFKSDLYAVNFKKTNLEHATFRDVHMRNADLSDAFISSTTFANADLSSINGLNTVKHAGSSYIDIETIYQSQGNIPEAFLRGCGLPEHFITYIPSLIGQAIDYYSCFISYSSKDQAFAERLYADLQSKGVRCWFAPEDMKIGDKFRFRIDESIRVHEKLLLVLSENSIASDWVEKEVETAMEKERENKKAVLFPVRLDDSVNAIRSGWAADVRRTRHIGDFSRWKSHDEYEKGFERLLRDLKIESSAEGEA